MIKERVLVDWVKHCIGEVTTGYTLIWCYKGDEGNEDVPFEEDHINYLNYLKYARSIHGAQVIDRPDERGEHVQNEVIEPFSEFRQKENEILKEYINSKEFKQ